MAGFQGLESSAESDINYQDSRWDGVHSDLENWTGKGLVLCGVDWFSLS